MTYHEARLIFTGGEVTLKKWRRSMPLETLSREVASLASGLFDSWQWAADPAAGIVIEPTTGSNCLLMLIDKPSAEESPYL